MNIYEYENYRIFLSDFLAEKKASKEKGFSQRALAKKIGVSSSGFIANVISGRNNLTKKQILDVADAILLNKSETAYFEALVNFTQSNTAKEKNFFFARMVKLYKSKFKKLTAKQLSIFSKWHYAVLRELLFFYNSTDDYKKLGEMVEPQISAKEAKEAIEALQTIGLIQKDSSGKFIPSENNVVSTGDEVKKLFVSNFITETIEHAKESIERSDAKERDISALTLRVSNDTMKRVKDEIRMFRKKILQITESDKNPNRVYQLNTNFFPVTRKVEGE